MSDLQINEKIHCKGTKKSLRESYVDFVFKRNKVFLLFKFFLKRPQCPVLKGIIFFLL